MASCPTYISGALQGPAAVGDENYLQYRNSAIDQRRNEKAAHASDRTGWRSVRCCWEAEVLAMTEALKLQDALPEVPAVSLAGILAKLEVIVGADRDIGDPTDFPWPHIASVLRDLKAIAGDLQPCELDRFTTRADITRHLQQAAQLVDSLEGEQAAEHIRQTAKSFAETSVLPKPAEF